MKRFHLLLACSAMIGVFACSDSSSNAEADDVDMNDGSSAVAYNGDGIFYLEKDTYEIDTEKSILTVREPVCEERKGELYWSLKGEESIATYKYNSSSKSINVKMNGENYSFKYYGKNFPVGHWISPDAENGVYIGFMLGDEGEFAYAEYFADSCYIDNLNALDLLESKDFGEEFKKTSCRTAETTKGLEVTVNSFKTGKFSITYSYGKKSCDMTVTKRFATNEDDCKAAYADYKKDQDAFDSFNFDAYEITDDAEDACFADLLATMDEENDK